MSGTPAVLRFSRDKRGYEHFYLIQPSHHRGKGPARILYWFRSPPGIRVGRSPFDEELQRRIEAQNPGVLFDWPRLLATPIPPPSVEVERWRERRLAEKAEKAARAARRGDLGDEVEGDIEPEANGAVAMEDGRAVAASGEPAMDPAPLAPVEERSPVEPVPAATAAAVSPVADRPSKRRRRRRRRHGRPRQNTGSSAPEQPPPVDDPGTSKE